MDVAVIGAGPAGLMAAEVLAQGGARVAVFDAKPSAGRKLLMAGRGGLNLTHSEPLPQFNRALSRCVAMAKTRDHGVPSGAAQGMEPSAGSGDVRGLQWPGVPGSVQSLVSTARLAAQARL